MFFQKTISLRTNCNHLPAMLYGALQIVRGVFGRGRSAVKIAPVLSGRLRQHKAHLGRLVTGDLKREAFTRLREFQPF